MASQEDDSLLGLGRWLKQRSRHGAIEEYGSIAVTVVENDEHEPVVVHDFSGPVLLEADALERHDTLIEDIGLVQDEGSVETTLPEHPLSDEGGQATLPSEIASMTKNLIGCGALSLCNGIALCSNAPAAIMAANIWIVAMGFIFGYFCWLIAKVCHMTGRHTYRGIWQETMGHRGSMGVSIANALKAALADLAYATILADTSKSLLASAGWDVPRTICLFLVTVTAILPLCLLNNLHVLAPFSVVGTAGIIFTAIGMAVRYMDGSYQPGGRFHDDIDESFQPLFGKTNGAWTTGVLPFVCMLYEAYVMHYNAPRFYTELKDRSLPRFGIAVSSSFGLSALVYAGIACFGFLTFGGNSSSFILNNYSPYDPLATVSRVAVGLSTLMAYPIVFLGVRDGVLDIFEVPAVDQTHQKLNSLTLVLLSILTVIAVFVTDLGLINAVGGGLVSTMIVFVFPTLIFRSAVRQMQKEASATDVNAAVMTTGLTVIGVVLGVIGAWLAVAGTTGENGQGSGQHTE